MKITAGKLRQIIREELGREEVSAEDLVLTTIPAPADEKEAQDLARTIVMGSENDQADAASVDMKKREIYFFASADDMRSWQKMTKEDRMDKAAPAAKEKSYMEMTDEELISKVPEGQMRSRMGGPGRDLFMGVKEGDPVPTPTEDLKFVMDKWETVRDIPGATLSIRRYPSNFKKMHRFDRGRPNMIWGDVNYPSLD